MMSDEEVSKEINAFMEKKSSQLRKKKLKHLLKTFCTVVVSVHNGIVIDHVFSELPNIHAM